MKGVFVLVAAGAIVWGAIIIPNLTPVGNKVQGVMNAGFPWPPPPSVDQPGLRLTVDCSTGEWYSWDVYTWKVTGLRCPPSYPTNTISVSVVP